MTLRDKIKLVMESCKLTTISTVSQNNGKPQSALIAFAENNDLELFFQTSNMSRKYQNLVSSIT